MSVPHSATRVLFNKRWHQSISAYVMSKSSNPLSGLTETTNVTIDNDGGVIQPTKEDLLEQFPGLNRTKEHITIWCSTQFVVENTIINWKGNEYRVKISKDWSEYGIRGFYRSIAERLELKK